MFDLLVQAAIAILSPENLMMLLAGVALGMLVGALPGLTATMGVAIFTPLTFFAPPEQGLCLLLGIYNAAMFGGAIPAILFNTPGTPAAIATTFDGYAMAKEGRAGLALSLSALGSAGGGLLSLVAFALFAFPLAEFALRFGPVEYFALAIFGLSMMIAVSGKSIVKGLLTGFLGLAIATVGLDPVYGAARFTFGVTEFVGGLSLIPIMVGLFGMGEVLVCISESETFERKLISTFGRLLPTWNEIKKTTPAFLIGSGIGTIIGAIPAVGGDIAGIISWERSKRISKEPEKFGKGSPEGLVAAETANNSVIGGAMTTMLTLGIPGDAVTAVLIGSLMMWGLQPGPTLFRDHPALIYKIIAIMIFANLFSLFFSLFRIRTMAGIIVKLPHYILHPLIILLCMVGSYAIQFSMVDVWIMLFFGLIGFTFRKMDFPQGPIVLGIILGPLAEANLQRSLILSDGSWLVFLQHPISFTLLALSFISLWGGFRKKFSGIK